MGWRWHLRRYLQSNTAEMLNALVQLSVALNLLLFNFLAPMTYGLALYGEFIATNAIVFLVHRTVSIVIEPLIGFASADTIIYSSLSLSALVVLVFAAINACVPIGSPVLLVSILLSANVMLSLQALRLRRAFIAYIMTASTLFAALLAWTTTHDLALSMVRAMELTIGPPALAWLVFVLRKSAPHPRGAALKATLVTLFARVPQMLSVTAVMSMFISALPVFLARTLVPYDLGLFKVMTSVIQSAVSVFPVSTQSLLASFVQHSRGGEFYRLLRGMATLYFAAMAAGLIVLAQMIPSMEPYIGLAVCLPVFYRAILAERYCIARKRIRPLALVNIAIVLLAIMLLPHLQTVPRTAFLYSCGFTLYAVVLMVVEGEWRTQFPSLVLMLACPFAVVGMAADWRVGLAYMALVAGVEWMRHRPTRADVKLLWREL